MTEDPRRHLIEIAIEPKSKADQEKFAAALPSLAADDPFFGVSVDSESGQTILAGDSVSRLKHVIERLSREFGVQANIGQPQVAYRETLGRPTTIDYTHKKQTGGSGQFARVIIEFRPLEPGGGEAFVNTAPESNVPKAYVPGVEKGLRSVAESGILAGFPVIDYKATLVDGAYHDVDSSVMAFEIAARAAFREAGRSAKPKLLEPIMEISITAPSAAADAIRAAIHEAQGHIKESRLGDEAATFIGEAPLATMFDAEHRLARRVDAVVSVNTRFLRYQPVPQVPPPDGPDDVFPPAIGMRA